MRYSIISNDITNGDRQTVAGFQKLEHAIKACRHLSFHAYVVDTLLDTVVFKR